MDSRITLLHNLMDRLEYNESQRKWKLTGYITQSEREAFQAAIFCFADHLALLEKERETER